MVPLDWSPWLSIDILAFSALPAGYVGYRVRVFDHKALGHMRPTGRDLRARLRDLTCNTLFALMPFNNPRTAAPSLWPFLMLTATSSNAFSFSDRCLAQNYSRSAPRRAQPRQAIKPTMQD